MTWLAEGQPGELDGDGSRRAVELAVRRRPRDGGGIRG